MSKFYGETEKKLKTIFETARSNAPALIFIDEIDALSPSVCAEHCLKTRTMKYFNHSFYRFPS